MENITFLIRVNTLFLCTASSPFITCNPRIPQLSAVHCSQDTLLSFPPSPFIGNSPPKSTFCRLNHLPHKCGHGQAQSCPALAKDTATVPITNSHFLKAFLPPKTCGSFTHMNCISISFFYFDNFLLIVRMWDLSN